jgi:serine/threonine protein kinase/Tol biopolymer transport system component
MQAERWKKIEEIYQAAAALPPEKRAALLEERCPGNPDLRAEVEQMLEAAGSRDSLLDGSPLSSLVERQLALEPGDKLGAFEIIASIGRGGMGEVYQARDVRLNRMVAIKILPPWLAESAESRERFEREARMIASLNHPHICTLHDVGHLGVMDYLVMEFLEGETLASRLLKGPLPLEQTLLYAMQIAGALDVAHRRGMTHRDLKPGNVMLTKSGAKLLDFGLAKLKHCGPLIGVSPTQHPTATHSITAQGSILGTLQYMAPEQLEGRDTDARTDIFALGAVIYEMATGKKAFEGGSQASIIARILETDPPPIRSLQPMTPASLDRVTKACLAKDPDARLQSAQDVNLELQWIRDAPDEPGNSGGTAPLARWRRTLPWILFGATTLLFGLFASWRLVGNKSAVPAKPVRFQILLSTKPPLRPTGLMALSPDGERLALVATGADGVPRIWIRALDSLEMRPLPGTEAVGSLMFWSPDGRFIAFDSGGKLLKIDVSGGPPRTVCELNGMGVGGSWSKDGVIVFGLFGKALMQVSAGGGVATPLTVLDPSHDIAHTVPWFLPDGKHFLYMRDNGLRGAISVGSLDAKPGQQDPRRLLEVASAAAYAPSADPDSGWLLFLRGQTLMAQPFDARRLTLSGEPVRVVEEPIGVYLDYSLFTLSANGTLAYISAGRVDSQLTWFDAAGTVQSKVGEAGPYVGVALSPDGTRAFVYKRTEIPERHVALWLLDLARGTSTRSDLDSSADNMDAVWAPDGRSIIFGSARAGQMKDIYEKPVSSVAEAKTLMKSNEWKNPLSWSPDGRFLLYGTAGEETKNDLWVLPLEDHQKPVPFLRTAFDEVGGRFSPDGRWVAYASDESGRYEVYVRAFSPGATGGIVAGDKVLISSNGGYDPFWRGAGKDLYYIDLAGKLMAVTVSMRPVFQASVPRTLFQAPPRGADEFGQTQWAPSPDGSRFLFLVPNSQEEAPVTVVLNWQAGQMK